MSLYYSMGIGHRDKQDNPIRPKVRDVLECLLMGTNCLDYDTFEDWAENFGYDTDSRSAERGYNACIGEARRLREFLGKHYGKFMEVVEEL